MQDEPAVTAPPEAGGRGESAAAQRDGGQERAARMPALPAWRIGLAGGVVGILCCAGPAVLALLGVVSGATALAWANDLYGGYAWWFRAAGLAALAVLVAIALRRRNACSVRGARTHRRRIVAAVGVAVGTYAALYAVTTWLGTLA